MGQVKIAIKSVTQPYIQKILDWCLLRCTGILSILYVWVLPSTIPMILRPLHLASQLQLYYGKVAPPLWKQGFSFLKKSVFNSRFYNIAITVYKYQRFWHFTSHQANSRVPPEDWVRPIIMQSTYPLRSFNFTKSLLFKTLLKSKNKIRKMEENVTENISLPNKISYVFDWLCWVFKIFTYSITTHWVSRWCPWHENTEKLGYGSSHSSALPTSSQH
jgi:hypothetical protein